jgi:hypothetical protein
VGAVAVDEVCEAEELRVEDEAVEELVPEETDVAPFGPMLKVPEVAKTLLMFPTSTSSRVYPSLKAQSVDM